MKYKLNRTWAEVDLDSLVHNFNEFVRITKTTGRAERVKIMAVVKANAYGHGAVTTARTLVEAGADYLAVATLDEAIELRAADITAPILVLSYVTPDRHEEIVRYDILSTVYQEDTALALSETALKRGKTAKVHIKIDTGMTRVGFSWNTAAKSIGAISSMRGLAIDGAFTHFASADEPDTGYTRMQFERFMHVAQQCGRMGIEIPHKHVCNSAAAIHYGEMHLDMIRPGISLYGYSPSGEDGDLAGRISLRPVMALKTEVIRVNDADGDVCVSYGRTFRTARKSRIATLPVGYADGFSRMLSGKAAVLIGGRCAPVIGRICMDQCMADITELPGNVSVGDEVVLFGAQGGSRITADDVARQLGTISYEVLCMVAKRVPRYYFKNQEIIGAENYLI